LVRAATHGSHARNVLSCMEGCNVDKVNDPYVLKLELEYKFLRAELEKENNKFELIKKQHSMTVSELADDITRKFFEYQTAKRQAIQEMKNERR
jgi:hypothetical protein